MADIHHIESKGRGPRDPGDDDGAAALWRSLNDKIIEVDTLIAVLQHTNLEDLVDGQSGIFEGYADVMRQHVSEAQESIEQLRDRYGRTYDDFRHDPDNSAS